MALRSYPTVLSTWTGSGTSGTATATVNPAATGMLVAVAYCVGGTTPISFSDDTGGTWQIKVHGEGANAAEAIAVLPHGTAPNSVTATGTTNVTLTVYEVDNFSTVLDIIGTGVQNPQNSTTNSANLALAAPLRNCLIILGGGCFGVSPATALFDDISDSFTQTDVNSTSAVIGSAAWANTDPSATPIVISCNTSSAFSAGVCGILIAPDAREPDNVSIQVSRQALMGNTKRRREQRFRSTVITHPGYYIAPAAPANYLPRVVNSATGTAASATSITLTIPSTIGGTALVAIVGGNAASGAQTPSFPAGWTLLDQSNTVSTFFATAIIPVSAAGVTSVQVTGLASGTNSDMCLIEIGGVASNIGFGHNLNANANSTPVTSAAIVPPALNCVAIAFGGNQGTGNKPEDSTTLTFSNPSNIRAGTTGNINENNGNNNTGISWAMDVQSIASLTSTSSAASSSRHTAGLLVLYPAWMAPTEYSRSVNDTIANYSAQRNRAAQRVFIIQFPIAPASATGTASISGSATCIPMVPHNESTQRALEQSFSFTRQRRLQSYTATIPAAPRAVIAPVQAVKSISGSAVCKVAGTASVGGSAVCAVSTIKVLSGSAVCAATATKTATGSARCKVSAVASLGGSATCGVGATAQISGSATCTVVSLKSISGSATCRLTPFAPNLSLIQSLEVSRIQTIQRRKQARLAVQPASSLPSYIIANGSIQITGSAVCKASAIKSISGSAKCVTGVIPIRTLRGNVAMSRELLGDVEQSRTLEGNVEGLS